MTMSLTIGARLGPRWTRVVALFVSGLCALASSSAGQSAEDAPWFGVAMPPAFEPHVPPVIVGERGVAPAVVPPGEDAFTALTGGADGLDAFHAIGPDIARLLAPGGFVALEIGAGQAEAVSTMLRDAGLGQIRVHADLAGRPRCAVATALDKPMRGKEETSWKSVG